MSRRWQGVAGPSGIVVLWALLGPQAPQPASAQNLLANPELDADASGWNLPYGGAWDGTEDANGCDAASPGSGAARTTSASIFGTSYSGFEPTACFEVAPGEAYFTSIAYLSPVAGDVFLTFYPEPACAGAPEVLTFGSALSPTAFWSTYSEGFTVPAGKASLKFGWATVDVLNSTYEGLWDRAYLGEADRVFADDFETGGPCRWVVSPPPGVAGASGRR